jgi:hypothetical protein
LTVFFNFLDMENNRIETPISNVANIIKMIVWKVHIPCLALIMAKYMNRSPIDKLKNAIINGRVLISISLQKLIVLVELFVEAVQCQHLIG